MWTDPDSGELRTKPQATCLAQVRFEVDRRQRDFDAAETLTSRLAGLIDALDWFAAPDDRAVADDGPRRWNAADRLRGGISIFPAIPGGSGDPRLGQSLNRATCFAHGGVPQAREWIALAEQELAAGLPAYALAVGGELHWADHDETRQRSRELLIGAYQALDRQALADIIDVHTAQRDLPSVQILVPSHRQP